MSDLIIPKDHISFTSISDLNDLCAPLFRHTEIDFLNFCRIYHDNSLIYLNSYPEFHEYLFSEIADKIFTWDVCKMLTKNNTNDYFDRSYWLVDEVITTSLSSDFVERFKLVSGIEFVEKMENYYEVFWFASRSGKNILSFYFNHPDILENFMLYFKEQAVNLITRHEKERVIVPRIDSKYKTFLEKTARNIYPAETDINKLYQEIKLNKYPIFHNGKKIYLTPREVDCLKHLATGKTWKHIANILQLSPRTVETRIEHAKAKLGVYSKTQLLDVFCQSPLINI